MKEPKQFAVNNAALIDAVLSVLQYAGASPQTGEHVLLWCVGLSMGWRQQPLAKPDDSIALDVLATAWQIGAADPH